MEDIEAYRHQLGDVAEEKEQNYSETNTQDMAEGIII